MKTPKLALIMIFFQLVLRVDQSEAQVSDFHEAVKKTGIQFTPPEGFATVPVIENTQMSYSIAYKDTVADIEVRYRIDLIDTLALQMEKKRIDSLNASGGGKGTILDPNDIHTAYTIFLAVLSNVSDRSVQIPELAKRVMSPRPDEVKRDFNGDWALVSMVTPGSTFAGDNKTCVVSYLHQDNVANVWSFILFKDREAFMQKGREITSALKFKE